MEKKDIIIEVAADYKGKNKLTTISLYFLIIAGFAVSVYLLYRHYLLVTGTTAKIDICSAVFGKGCDTALSSTISTQFGLPLSSWGIIYYVLLAAILILPKFIDLNNKLDTYIPFFIVSLFGCFSSIALLLMMIFNRSLLCPFCVTIHIINLLIFINIIRFRPFSLPFFLHTLSKTIGSLFNLKQSSDVIKIKWLTIGTFALLSFSLYIGLQIFEDYSQDIYFENMIAEYDRSPLQQIPVDENDPVLGNANAPVKIIVFSDFECSSCKLFSGVVKDLNFIYRDKIYIVFKHFPLGKACNPALGNNDFHPKACEAALSAEAARQQGKFWQYHDALFSIDLEKAKPELFSSIAARNKLNVPKFEQVRHSEAAQHLISRSIDQGNKLKITGTPAVYLNGRFVKDFRLYSIQLLIERLLLTK
jgi:protein-disulfide isomerase/uncharacterized membrane protein